MKKINILKSIVEEPEKLLCQYLVKYLPGVEKLYESKLYEKLLSLFYPDKKCFIKFNVD